MRIAAFDIGRVGAMVDNSCGALLASHVDLNPRAGTKHDISRPKRFAAWHLWLDLKLPHELDLIVYERPFGRGQDATRCGWGYAAVLESIAGEFGIPIRDYGPSEIKKWATGSGVADKDDMTLAARYLFDYPGDNEHEADAWCLHAYATSLTPKD